MSSLPFDGILAMTRFVAGSMRSTSAPRWVTTQIEPKPLAMSPGESAVPTVAATYRGGVGELGVEGLGLVAQAGPRLHSQSPPGFDRR